MVTRRPDPHKNHGPPGPPGNNPSLRAPPEFGPARKRINLRDIAQALQVTAMSVSRALRNESGVSPKLRKRILAKAREMGYEPDPALSALQYYRRTRTAHPITSTIAWLNSATFPSSPDLYWKGAFDEAEKFGYRLEKFDIGGPYPPSRVSNILRARNIEAVLLPNNSSEIIGDWSGFDWEHLSAVRLGCGIEFHSVSSDEMGNAILAFNTIRKRGYRRIGFFGLRALEKRSGAGFLWAQTQEAETDRVPIFLFSSSQAVEHQKGEFAQWLEQHRPEALLGEAPSAFALLAQLGYRIPEEIAAASTSLLYPSPPVDAGIDPRAEEIGRLATQSLISLIHNHERGFPTHPRQLLVQGQWVDGKSLPEIL